MDVSSVGNTQSKTVDADSVGFAGLNSDHFMKLLITQLQNQDPLEPLSNEELLNQLSVMRNLEANIELKDSLEAITLDQQLSGAASFLGRQVTAESDAGVETAGVVDRVSVRDGQAYLSVGGQSIPVSTVVSVADAAA